MCSNYKENFLTSNTSNFRNSYKLGFFIRDMEPKTVIWCEARSSKQPLFSTLKLALILAKDIICMNKPASFHKKFTYSDAAMNSLSNCKWDLRFKCHSNKMLTDTKIDFVYLLYMNWCIILKFTCQIILQLCKVSVFVHVSLSLRWPLLSIVAHLQSTKLYYMLNSKKGL
jgi:hypothetical protein